MINDKAAIDMLYDDALGLLKKLIQIPSFSREEQDTADLLCLFFDERQVSYQRVGNNVWAYNRYADPDKPTILLNSHHDTVKPNPGYTRDPFAAVIEEDRLYGLGSNDAGGCLVSLIAAFLYYHKAENLSYNLCLLASAEEEISGKDGIEEAIRHTGRLAFAIVGEPTLLNLAVAEKGLMVLDCEAYGKAGHAAREEGENAIYKAMDAIGWFRGFQFPKVSPYLGPVKMTVTVINAGSQHNVVPASCKFVVDVRTTEMYSHDEVLAIIREHVHVDVKPRSTRLTPSTIPLDHPLVQSGIRLGASTYGSPTMSDQALLSVPSLKVGPGDSARSHMADEFIFLSEIRQGIMFYIDLLGGVL